jgi:hypothetical protein
VDVAGGGASIIVDSGATQGKLFLIREIWGKSLTWIARLGGLIVRYGFPVAVLPGPAPAPVLASQEPVRERCDRERNRPPRTKLGINNKHSLLTMQRRPGR